MVSATAETPTMTPKMSEKAAASEDMASIGDGSALGKVSMGGRSVRA